MRKMRNPVLIIGASRGIGAAIAETLEEDHLVINMSRTKSTTKAVGSVYFPMDLTDPISITEAYEYLEYKKLDPEFFIYCAGYVEPQSILEMTPKSLIDTININLTGAIRCTKLFLDISGPYNKKLIFIASTAGTRPQPGWSAYAAAKAGLINFALTVGEELRSYNTRVYCISPGRCATELRRVLAPNEDQSKIMQPDEVAEIIKSLILDDGILDRQNIIVRR